MADDGERYCRCCGLELESGPAKLLGVCVTCVQHGGRQIPLPKPPGYAFNPWTDEPPRRQP